MSATRRPLAILGSSLVLLAACSGGETVLGGRDGVDEADAETAGEADVTAEAIDAAADVEDETEDAVPVCGNAVVEDSEECDLLDLDGETCVTLGHPAGGTLRCDATCGFDESLCRNPICGNFTCDLGETPTRCPADCHDGCGDGSCAEAEDQFGCPADCGAIYVSAAGTHSCAVLADGTGRCWGDNGWGRLGDGTRDRSAVPVVVAGLTAAVTIEGGAEHSCALLSGGAVKCWGANDDGQLGDGTNVANVAPVVVSGVATAVAVDTGWWHGCALLADGTVRCWGRNAAGQLGDGTTTSSNVPVTVIGLHGAVEVAAGESHSCALLADGTARCWGNNLRGQLGDGTTTASSVPLAVAGLGGAVNIAAGGAPSCGTWMADGHSCAVLRDGSVACWGSNDCGQLGDGTTTASGLPIAVAGLATDARAVSVDECRSCTLLADGSASCWGVGPGPVPTLVADLPAARRVSVGGMRGCLTSGMFCCAQLIHVCAIGPNDTVWCWGNNVFGQLGDGTTTDSNVPVQVAAW